MRLSGAEPDPPAFNIHEIHRKKLMAEIIDLSQEMYDGMPVFKGLPQVRINIHATHEQWDRINDATTRNPSELKMDLGEHRYPYRRIKSHGLHV